MPSAEGRLLLVIASDVARSSFSTLGNSFTVSITPSPPKSVDISDATALISPPIILGKGDRPWQSQLYSDQKRLPASPDPLNAKQIKAKSVVDFIPDSLQVPNPASRRVVANRCAGRIKKGGCSAPRFVLLK
jgi:hypothetical protein